MNLTYILFALLAVIGAIVLGVRRFLSRDQLKRREDRATGLPPDNLR